MKPLPAETMITGKNPGGNIPSLPNALPPKTEGFSTANNRRAPSSPLHRSSPWLLAGSMLLAAAFCILYITKPVIVAPAPEHQSSAPSDPALSLNESSPDTAGTDSLMPASSKLPGEPASPAVKPKDLHKHNGSPVYEETNLRIQHVIAAETPDGPVARIDIDVPVLYQSRNLRWDTADVARARDLMLRLMEYQEKSRALRSEGIGLLTEWKTLVNHSTPATALRADSPSLPINQQWAADSPLPITLDTGESVQLKTEEP